MALLDADERTSLRAAQAGSASGFESVFRAHWPRAFRASYLIVLDHAAAEELVLESFLGAVRSLDAFGAERPFAPWLHRLVVNRSIDRARARLLQPSGLRGVGERTEPLEWAAVPLGGPHLDPAATALAAGLAALSPDLRAVVVLRYLLEYTPAEAEDVLDVPKSVVSARLDQATARLRAQLDARAPADDRTLRTLLLQLPVPGEHLAVERTWEIVRAAFGRREPAPRRRRLPLRTLGVLAALAAIALAIWLSPAGSAIADWWRGGDGGEEVVTATVQAPAAAAALPAPGRLLVADGDGVYVLDEDGTRSSLGEYDAGAWEPSGRFVAVWRRSVLVGLDPSEPDLPLWEVRGRRIADARWSADGFRVAYRARDLLRMVNGTGGDRRLVARGVADVAPAWRPGEEHVLAYAEKSGRVRIVDADSRQRLSSLRVGAVVALDWTEGGERLAVLARRDLLVVEEPRRVTAVVRLPATVEATALAARPGSQDLAYAVFSPETGTGSVFLFDGQRETSRLLFAGSGRFPRILWSPDGRFLLVPWREAGQWLFLPVDGGDVSSLADAGNVIGLAGFPRPDGWCCVP